MILAEIDWAADERRQVRRLRLLSLAEGLTLLVLMLVAVPAKHLFGWPVATRVMGPIHGLAFLAYGWTLIATVAGGSHWSKKEVAWLVLAALVPFGALAVAGLLRRKEAAVGVRPGAA